MNTLVDNAITIRILKLLTTPWVKQKAYMYGIIDAHGNPLRKYSDLKTKDERNAYTILIRLVFRLKRIIELVPVGNKQFLSYAAAFALLKECHDIDHEPLDFERMFFEVRQLDGLPVRLIEDFINSPEPMQSFANFREDAGAAGAVAANSTGSAVVGTGDDNTTVVPKKKQKVLRRSNP